MPSHNNYHLTWVSLTLDMGYLFMAAPKMCLTSLILRERQIKTMMRYHSHILEWVLSKKQKITNDGKDMEKGEPLSTVGKNVN